MRPPSPRFAPPGPGSLLSRSRWRPTNQKGPINSPVVRLDSDPAAVTRRRSPPRAPAARDPCPAPCGNMSAPSGPRPDRDAAATRPHPHRGDPRPPGRPPPPCARRRPRGARRRPRLRSPLGPDPDVPARPHRAPAPTHRRGREGRPPRPGRDRPRVPAAHCAYRGCPSARRHRLPYRLRDAGLRVRERPGDDGALAGYPVALPGDRADRGSRPVWFAGSTLAYDLSQPRVRERFPPARLPRRLGTRRDVDPGGIRAPVGRAAALPRGADSDSWPATAERGHCLSGRRTVLLTEVPQESKRRAG